LGRTEKCRLSEGRRRKRFYYLQQNPAIPENPNPNATLKSGESNVRQSSHITLNGAKWNDPTSEEVKAKSA
jgi:hypothetical protein